MAVGFTGYKTFEIDHRNFLSGMTSSPFTQDGGFSNQSIGTNLTYELGILHIPPQMVDKSTNVIGTIIASAADGRLISPKDRLFIDDEGHYYSWNGTTMTLEQTDSSGNTYDFPQSDIQFYKGYVYVTAKEEIVQWDIGGGSIDTTYHTFSNALAPHPILLYEDNLYYGDGNLLIRQTSAGASTFAADGGGTVLTLPSGQTIVALGIDPGTGRMLISTVVGLNFSNTLNPICRVMYYDGFSPKVDKSIVVDEMITCFYPVGGFMYIGYGQNLGYWTGSGIGFLRKLSVALNVDELPYKGHLTNIGRTLYVVEGVNILAHGELLGGTEKVFYYPMFNTQSNAKFSNLVNIGGNKLSMAFTTDQFWTWDSSAAPNPGTNPTFYTKKFEFPRPVNFQTLRLQFSANLPLTTGDIGTIRMINDAGVTTTLLLITNTTASGLRNDIDVPYPNLTTRSMQFTWNVSATRPEAIGLEKITVFYTEVQ